MPVSSASGLSNHPGHEGQSYRLPNTRKKHARRAGASDHSHGSNLMGIGNNNPLKTVTLRVTGEPVSISITRCVMRDLANGGRQAPGAFLRSENQGADAPGSP